MPALFQQQKRKRPNLWKLRICRGWDGTVLQNLGLLVLLACNSVARTSKCASHESCLKVSGCAYIHTETGLIWAATSHFRVVISDFRVCGFSVSLSRLLRVLLAPLDFGSGWIQNAGLKIHAGQGAGPAARLFLIIALEIPAVGICYHGKTDRCTTLANTV